MDVSDRSLQAMLTQEAKITSASFLSEVIFAFGGFVNALKPKRTICASALAFWVSAASPRVGRRAQNQRGFSPAKRGASPSA